MTKNTLLNSPSKFISRRSPSLQVSKDISAYPEDYITSMTGQAHPPMLRNESDQETLSPSPQFSSNVIQKSPTNHVSMLQSMYYTSNSRQFQHPIESQVKILNQTKPSMMDFQQRPEREYPGDLHPNDA